jgi:GNAT superfamily N-acetyltransferase
LTVAPDLSPETYEARFDAMLASPETYFVLVFAHKETGKILASASLMVELKFLRDAGKVGHIEDVVVDPECKGQSLGKIMIQGLSELGMQRGCYKVILDCDAKNAGEFRSLFSLPSSIGAVTDHDSRRICCQASTKSAGTATSASRWPSTSNRHVILHIVGHPGRGDCECSGICAGN